MRRADAPRPGWYPDPENRTRLRWWDGLDWSDHRRAPPSDAEMDRAADALMAGAAIVANAPDPATGSGWQSGVPNAGLNRSDAQEIIGEVRNVARTELDRAAEQFSVRTQSAIRSVTPLVSSYTNQLLRWVRFAAIVATVLVIAWFVFQVIVQQSLFEWIGDRIDNATNGGSDSSTGSGSILVEKVPENGP